MKEISEMNKKELHKMMAYNNKEMRRIKNGTASEYMTMDYSYYYAIRDENSRIMAELRFRGISQADIKIHDTALDLAFAAMKTLEKQLAY